MILTCPSCGTQYVVKDGAIPPGGRQVRCASCKHSWHQDPEEGAAGNGAGTTIDETPPEAPGEAGPDTVSEATLIDPRSGPEAEELAYEEAVAEEYSPDAGAPDSAFAGGDFDDDQRTESDGTFATGGISDLDQRTSADDAVADRDWNEPPQPEMAADEFSPFPVFEDEAPRKRSGLLT